MLSAATNCAIGLSGVPQAKCGIAGRTPASTSAMSAAPTYTASQSSLTSGWRSRATATSSRGGAPATANDEGVVVDIGPDSLCQIASAGTTRIAASPARDRCFGRAAGAVHVGSKNGQAPLESGALARRACWRFASANKQFKPVRAALAVVFVQGHALII